jgi:NAD(P)-dependent dehydrogenase (short-subunit alcohol dehydrogenase family)
MDLRESGLCHRRGQRLGVRLPSLAGRGSNIVLHVHTSSGIEVAQAIEALGDALSFSRLICQQPGAGSWGRQRWLLLAISTSPEQCRCFLFHAPANFDCAVLEDNATTNLTSPFVLSLMLVRVMQAQGRGKIVQLGDWSGINPSLNT